MRAAIAAFALLAFGCDPSVFTPGSATSSVNARQSDGGGCFPGLDAGGVPGDTCLTFRDCREICCRCARGAQQFSAAACVDERCADPAITCSKSEASSPNLCL